MASSTHPSGRHWAQWSTLLTFTFVFSLLSSVHAQYFIVNQPSGTSSWANGSPYPLQWTKGLHDGINAFDVELTRLGEAGRILLAKNVPATYKSLNVLLQDVPPADDYFLICLNGTTSVIYAVSSRFSITSNTSSDASNPHPDPAAPTVTAVGPPNPLNGYAATLGASANSAGSLIVGPASEMLGAGSVLMLSAALLGGAMALW